MLLVSAVVLAGCGSEAERAGLAAQGARGAPPSAEAVVRGWAADMRRGDVDAATARFAVPAIVANGTPEIRLETRRQVRLFNDTLPCGGRVVDTERHHGVIIATFVLTDRPGGDCGTGTGSRAKAAFEVRGGRIVRWLRVPMEGERAAPPRDVV